MPYTLNTPWRWETYGTDYYSFTPYSRLAGRAIAGGNITGTTNPFLTDVPRGVSLLVSGTIVTENMTPSQDDLAAADYYFLGGHEYTLSDTQAQVLIDAGYGDYLTQL
jgi:hypothetical protein